MTQPYCCEACWRNPTCGNDCGSCGPEDDEERDPVNGQLVSARVGAVNQAADVLAAIIREGR
jgi:hypothetical protein